MTQVSLKETVLDLPKGYFYKPKELGKPFIDAAKAVGIVYGGKLATKGSCFAIEKDGQKFLVSARHCFRREDGELLSRQVSFSGGLDIEAKAGDFLPLTEALKYHDLAVARLRGQEADIPILPLAKGQVFRIVQEAEDFVVSLGYPLDYLRRSSIGGPLSGVGRILNREYINSAGIIESDARVEQGHSGGPLINEKGEAIGVMTQMDLRSYPKTESPNNEYNQMRAFSDKVFNPYPVSMAFSTSLVERIIANFTVLN